MARIRLIHWDESEGRRRKATLASLGHQIEYDAEHAAVRGDRANPPDAIVIDLSRLPSHGREVAMWVRTSKALRHVPIVFVDGERDKVEQVKAILPDATYTTWGRLKAALPKALAKPATAPVVPPSSLYTGKPAIEKLGVKAGATVALLNAPKGFADSLKPKPPRVKFTATPSQKPDLFLVFVRTRHELATLLQSLTRDVDRQTVWFIWRKQAAGGKSEVNGNVVRETGLAAGWVDFKICAIDATWSGLAFKRRK